MKALHDFCLSDRPLLPGATTKKVLVLNTANTSSDGTETRRVASSHVKKKRCLPELLEHSVGAKPAA